MYKPIALIIDYSFNTNEFNKAFNYSLITTFSNNSFIPIYYTNLNIIINYIIIIIIDKILNNFFQVVIELLLT